MSVHAYTRADDLSLALRLADAADAITMERYQALDLVVTTKPDLTPVTDADKATEREIRDLLQVARPQDGLVGEEFGGVAESEERNAGSRYWVVDPIDGTKNFMRGVPTWATLIALVENGVVVVGVASAPALARRWYAAEKSGAFVTFRGGDPRKISVSGVKDLENASLLYSDLVGWGNRLPNFMKMMQKSWRTRVNG